MRTLLSVLAISTVGLGQTAPPAPRFEVASLKPADPGARMGNLFQGGPGTPDPTRLTVTNAVLQGIITRAFGVRFDQISGPDWMNQERFDISATVPPGTTKEQANTMLLTLLVERFHLSYHTVQKEFPVYDLTVARSGPKLKESAPAGGPQGTRVMATCEGSRLTSKGRDAAGVAQVLESAVGGRVVDKTGLTGTYDIELYYTPQQIPRVMNCDGKNTDAPVVFEAVQQQLGLKLDKTSAMLKVVVIDRMDRMPREN